MQRGSRSWTRDDDVKLIEAAIFAKRRSRVPARVDLGKNGPKFYYDNAAELLRYLPPDWKQRFNFLLDLYRGEKMTVQLSKMLAAARDGRLYREKERGEAVESSDEIESEDGDHIQDSDEAPRGAKRRDKGRLNGAGEDAESSDGTRLHPFLILLLCASLCPHTVRDMPRAASISPTLHRVHQAGSPA